MLGFSGLTFSEPDLAARVEALSPGAIDTLPFGVVLLDRRNRIVLFNSVERSQSGMGQDVIGKNFFSIARHLDGDHFRSHVDGATEERRDQDTLAEPFSLRFDVQGDYDAPDRHLVARVENASQGGVWLFLDRPADGKLNAAAAAPQLRV